jgi:hypothetical protein
MRLTATVPFTPPERQASGRCSFGIVPRLTAEAFDRLAFHPTTGEPFAVTRVGGQVRLAHAGQRAEPIVDQIGDIASARGRSGRFAYAARTGGQWRVIENNLEGPQWDSIENLQYNASGDRLAYIAASRHVISGAERFGPFDAIEGLGFTRDQRAVVYVAYGERARLMADGNVLAEADGRITPLFDKVGGLVGRFQRVGNKTKIVLGDRSNETDEDLSKMAAISNGRHLAYAVRDIDVSRVATEEGPGSFQSEYVSAPQFAGDQAVYSARVGPEWFIVANDRVWPLDDLVPETDLVVSPSGKYVAFGARRRRELWWRAIDVTTTAERAANETHWVMLSRGRSANGLTLDSNGRLMVGYRTVAGFQAANNVPNVIVSPASVERRFAFVSATGSPSLWIVDMTAVRAELLRLPGRRFTAISHLAWSGESALRFSNRSSNSSMWIANRDRLRRSI